VTGLTGQIAFDADDTLWENHLLFLALLHQFSAELHAQTGVNVHEIETVFFSIQGRYLAVYGYGLANFIPALLDLYWQYARSKTLPETLYKAVQHFRRQMWRTSPPLLKDAQFVLDELQKRGYRLLLITKGRFAEQQIKLRHSHLAGYFSEFYFLQEKNAAMYKTIAGNYDRPPLMIGNSLRSDIYPARAAGWPVIWLDRGFAWYHDRLSGKENYRGLRVTSLRVILALPLADLVN
jgi:putative hydrolase of the HAD superfamily